MKKILVLVIAAMLVLGLAGCSGSTSKVGLEAIKEKGKIVIGLDDNFPPMGFVDETGEIVGFDIDLAKAVGEKLGVEVEFKPVEWDGIILSLINKDIDLIWNGLTITEERTKKIGFSEAYMANKQIVVVNGDSKVSSLKDLSGKIVAAQLESSSSEAIDSKDGFKESLNDIKYYPTNTEAFMDLQIGRVDALVVDEILGRYYIEQSETDFKVLEEDLGKELYGIGMRMEDDTLKKEIDKYLKELKKEGKSTEISEKWFGEDIVLTEAE